MLKNILFVLVCLFITSSAIAGFYQEDYTSDTNGGLPGFASSVFVHSITGSYVFINAPLSAPDPPHAIQMFTGIDDITFSLGVGEQIHHARVGVLSAFGPCRVIFQGTNLDIDGVTPLQRTMHFFPTSNWQVAEAFDTTDSDKEDPNDPDEPPGPPIGVIRKITLIGGESVYDNIEIETTGGNPNPITAGLLINPKKNNINRSGHIRVAILSGITFDALSIDPNTVQFGNATTLSNAFAGDVEPDGDTDLVLFFQFQDIGIACGDTSVPFSARTLTGELVEGFAVIETLGCP